MNYELPYNLLCNSYVFIGMLTSSNIEAVEKRLDELAKGTDIETADATTFQGLFCMQALLVI